MAKDPAILWYWNDWNGGTSTFTRHLKGCYIDLLSSQFNSGRLSLAEIKTVLGADFGPSWPALQKKFRKDESGMYYNERMEEEQEKRKKFTDGRRKNLLSKKQESNHKADHMGDCMGIHVENVNEDANGIGVKERGSGKTIEVSRYGFFSDDLQPTQELPEHDAGKTIEFIRLKHRKILNYAEVRDQWEAFKIQQLTVHKWYNDFGDMVTHFRNALNLEIKNNGTGFNRTSDSGNNPKPAGGKQAGAKQLADQLRTEIQSIGPG